MILFNCRVMRTMTLSTKSSVYTNYFKKTIQLIAICLACFLNIPAAHTNSLASPKILVLGDSISAAYGMAPDKGWVNLLQQRLGNSAYSHYEVINASISGNTSGDGLSRLPQLLSLYSPKIVILELGGNDGLRGYPVKLMSKNLQKIIDLSEQNNAQVLLAGIEIPPNYGQRYTLSFRKTFQQLATNNDISYVPFILENIAVNPELMQKDGIHPTEEAQSILLDNIWGNVEELLQKIHQH